MSSSGRVRRGSPPGWSARGEGAHRPAECPQPLRRGRRRDVARAHHQRAHQRRLRGQCAARVGGDQPRGSNAGIGGSLQRRPLDLDQAARLVTADPGPHDNRRQAGGRLDAHPPRARAFGQRTSIDETTTRHRHVGDPRQRRVGGHRHRQPPYPEVNVAVGGTQGCATPRSTRLRAVLRSWLDRTRSIRPYAEPVPGPATPPRPNARV